MKKKKKTGKKGKKLVLDRMMVKPLQSDQLLKTAGGVILEGGGGDGGYVYSGACYTNACNQGAGCNNTVYPNCKTTLPCGASGGGGSY